MRELVKERLPTFSSQDEVNVTFDFVGLNYYTAYYAANANPADPDHLRYQTDSNAIIKGKNFVILVNLLVRLCPAGLKQAEVVIT
jgi:beta-glucosidase